MTTLRIVELDSDNEEIAPPQKMRRLCEACEDAVSPWTHACQLGHLYCVLALIDAKHAVSIDDERRTPLHIAAHGLITLTKFKLNDVTIDGSTCLHLAVKYEQYECVKVLLGKPTLPTAARLAMMKNAQGDTALHLAVQRNNNDIALYLLRRFGRMIAMVANAEGKIALHLAAGNGNIEFIRIVCNYSLTMCNQRDISGSTPILYAASAGKFSSVKYLLEKTKCDVTSLNDKRQSVLHSAVIGGDLDVVMYLMTRMASDAVYWLTNDRANVFHFAAYAGHATLFESLYRLARIDRPFLQDTSDIRGNTFLHLSVMKNRLECVMLLLHYEALPTVYNVADKTALDIAKERGYTKIVHLLKEALEAHERSKPVTGMQKVKRMLQRRTVKKSVDRERRRTINIAPGDTKDKVSRTLSPVHSAVATSGYGSSADLAEHNISAASPEIVVGKDKTASRTIFIEKVESADGCDNFSLPRHTHLRLKAPTPDQNENFELQEDVKIRSQLSPRSASNQRNRYAASTNDLGAMIEEHKKVAMEKSTLEKTNSHDFKKSTTSVNSKKIYKNDCALQNSHSTRRIYTNKSLDVEN